MLLHQADGCSLRLCRLRGRRSRARRARRRRPHRGHRPRQRRAHGQRRSRDARAQPLLARHRAPARFQRHVLGDRHGDRVHGPARPPAPPVRGRPRLYGIQRVAPGRDQEGVRGAARARGQGRPPLVAAVPSDRPGGRRVHVRGRHPRQFAVGQGRVGAGVGGGGARS